MAIFQVIENLILKSVMRYTVVWVKKSLDVTIDVVDVYIEFWSEDVVQEFYYDVSPLEVLEELKATLITGEYPTKMVEE